jgi:hypothetical protein
MVTTMLLVRLLLLSSGLLCGVSSTSTSRSAASRFGIGVYTDTPGAPPLEQQLDAALDLVGPGGWVTLFLCAWRTHTTSCMNRTTTQDPASSAMLRAAYARNLNVVARIGNPWAVRDHADDSTGGHHRLSYTALAAAYGKVVASLPSPPDGFAPLHVQVGNELNACNEWQCSGPSSTSMSSAQMAAEVAGFVGDVAAAIAPLRNGTHPDWPAGRLLLAHAPIANWDTSPCQCGTQKPLGGGRSGLEFVRDMLAIDPQLYSPSVVDFLSSHSYPYSGEPFGTDRATRGLTYYRNESALVGRPGPGFPVVLTETGWRRHAAADTAASESERLEGYDELQLEALPSNEKTPPKPAPTDAADQANWTVLAYEHLWLNDPQVTAVCPFLLAGKFWEASGWPWMVGGERLPVFNATRALRIQREEERW